MLKTFKIIKLSKGNRLFLFILGLINLFEAIIHISSL